MAETAAAGRGEAYYSTARTLGTGTTSTVTLQIWRLLDDFLVQHGRAMSATELSEATGLTVEQIDQIFAQEYYQKHYGFRRFNSLEEWRAWALETGVLYNPELHKPDPVPEEEAPAQEEGAAGESEA
ncbi:hypothetical protein J2Z79_001996 [Symbiobacterium terraclitae]|uniref:HTH araC/xylS-type domain-containing protein n=1 Tax=Symbiobacterium terraclitae TaxID=557451 RepID=A0ABS4JSR3_9FIRM|nr:hypothetical protein [Symbiobacterium terraclitae]MBP2018581.1 hypothetical protein [Symbiobacterium terraclitae]